MTSLKKTIITAVAGFGVSLAGLAFIPNSAEAKTCFDVLDGKAHLCNSYEYSTSKGDVYILGYADNTGAETGMTVTCRGSYAVDWKSDGNMDYDYLDTLADYFCSL